MSNYENESVRVVLKKDRDKSVRNYHPWIFSGAVAEVKGSFIPGDIVKVFSRTGDFLGKGFINPNSQIRIRILTFQKERIDDEFFLKRLSEARRFRADRIDASTTACRMVHGEGDYLSGLVIDMYNDVCVFQIHSQGMENLRHQLLDWMKAVFEPVCIVERSEGSGRREEGLEERRGLSWGKLPEKLVIRENGVMYYVDILEGQKTGFFLDQRDNRERIARLCSGKQLLNCFSYTGGFSLAAALNGALTTSVETSQSAQKLAMDNFVLNQLDPATYNFPVKNVFDFLSDAEKNFDVIVLDPPAFVKKQSQVNKGSRAYKEVNRLAMTALSSGGFLLSCSCSAHVSWDLFQKILFSAARESRRKVRIMGRYGQPYDHPINIYHPEGEYLKTFLLQVI